LTQLEIDVEDIASTLIEFKTEGRSLPVHLHQDYIQRPASRSCEVIGEQGKAFMDLVSMSVVHTNSAGSVVRSHRFEQFERNQLFLDELRHFLDCVEARSEPVPDLEDGIWSLRMALAARQSIAQGRVVMLNEYAKSFT
jgi:predicted dehydrogenase